MCCVSLTSLFKFMLNRIEKSASQSCLDYEGREHGKTFQLYFCKHFVFWIFSCEMLLWLPHFILSLFFFCIMTASFQPIGNRSSTHILYIYIDCCYFITLVVVSLEPGTFQFFSSTISASISSRLIWSINGSALWKDWSCIGLFWVPFSRFLK